MIKRFAHNRAVIATKQQRIATAQAEARARATAAPVFADISRFSEPSSSRMVWMASPTGQHPSFV